MMSRMATLPWSGASTRLSREGRDTLWLLAALTLSMAPHLTRLPLWCAVGALLALAWRAYLAWGDRPLPSRWVLTAALVGSVGLTLWSHHTIVGREAGITLVTVLASLKTLELRARRDAFVITSLGFFLVLTQFIHSQSPLMAALMLVVVWALMTSLVLAQRPLGRPPLWEVGRATARTMLMGLPVMLVLYVLFPRLGPLWSNPGLESARTGLSDRMEMGQVSELALDDSIAMRVRFEGSPPAPKDLYFRALVLGQFDGRTWLPRRPNSPPQALMDSPPQLRPGSPPRLYRYQLTLEPQTIPYLPLLDGTLQASPTPPFDKPIPQARGREWVLDRPLQQRAQLDAAAVLPEALQASAENAVSLRDWLQLPPGYNPRTLDWALRTRRQSGWMEAPAPVVVARLLAYIRENDFRYTLMPRDAEAPTLHTIDRFWLDSRAGFCEHFSSAFVVVLRAMDIPARVVTGFQGAERNPVDGLLVVRNSDAHAWVEYWEPTRGWVRVDPTAAVAPERVDRTRPALRFPQEATRAMMVMDQALWGTVRAYLDAGNHRWNLWVLSYSRQSQMDLLRRWGMERPDTTDLIRLTAIAVAVAGLVGALFMWWQWPSRARASAWARPLGDIHDALVRAGVSPPRHCPAPAPAATWAAHLKSGPSSIGLSAEQAHAHQAVIDGLNQLDALRYAAEKPTASMQRQMVKTVMSSIARLEKMMARTDKR